MSSYDDVVPVDTSGDINLIVTCRGVQKSIQVSLKAMSLAGPVWRTMLDPEGSFREADPNTSDSPSAQDDAEALLLLLATQLKYHEIPRSSHTSYYY